MIRIEEEKGALLFYRVSDEKLVHHCQKAEHPGEKINTVPSVADRAVSLTSVKRLFGNNETVCRYVEGIDKTCTRYKTAHYKWVLKLAKRFSLDELEEAMEHCIAENSCNTHVVDVDAKAEIELYTAAGFNRMEGQNSITASYQA